MGIPLSMFGLLRKGALLEAKSEAVASLSGKTG